MTDNVKPAVLSTVDSACSVFPPDRIDTLLYVLRFALDIIELHGLCDQTNTENWNIETSLEEQIEFLLKQNRDTHGKEKGGAE